MVMTTISILIMASNTVLSFDTGDFQVKSTLTDLKLAIDGTIVMSQALRASLDAMYDARIPERWKKVSHIFSHYFLH